MHDSFHLFMHQRQPVILDRFRIFVSNAAVWGEIRLMTLTIAPPPWFKVWVLEIKRPDSSGGSEDTQA